jgi:hypothetical protein
MRAGTGSVCQCKPGGEALGTEMQGAAFSPRKDLALVTSSRFFLDRTLVLV